MNRPPKKKIQSDGLSRDPRFDMEELEKAGSSTKSDSDSKAGDDRNLVEIDEAFQEAEFEDKVWLVWNKSKGQIVGGVIAAFAAVIGVQGYRAYQESSVISMQEAYSAAATNEQKLEFAGNYGGESLAGLALIENADALYLEEKFSEAASLYGQAAESLGESPVVARALLGQSIATYKSGDVANAKSFLSALVEKEDAMQGYRAEAAYHLTLIALESENIEEAKQWLARVESFEMGGRWVSLAEQLKSTTPSLEDKSEG